MPSESYSFDPPFYHNNFPTVDPRHFPNKAALMGAPPQPQRIETGAVVRLLSGGPCMVVYKTANEDHGGAVQDYAYVYCWLEDKSVGDYRFPYTVLQRVG